MAMRVCSFLLQVLDHTPLETLEIRFTTPVWVSKPTPLETPGPAGGLHPTTKRTNEKGPKLDQESTWADADLQKRANSGRADWL
jgi:hypothetical protein